MNTLQLSYQELEAYLSLCERFWKEQHERTYEKKLNELFEVKRRATRIYSLSGFDAYYTLFITLKPLRNILPLPRYGEHAAALSALEKIKQECQKQLCEYIKQQYKYNYL